MIIQKEENKALQNIFTFKAFCNMQVCVLYEHMLNTGSSVIHLYMLCTSQSFVGDFSVDITHILQMAQYQTGQRYTNLHQSNRVNEQQQSNAYRYLAVVWCFDRHFSLFSCIRHRHYLKSTSFLSVMLLE